MQAIHPSCLPPSNDAPIDKWVEALRMAQDSVIASQKVLVQLDGHHYFLGRFCLGEGRKQNCRDFIAAGGVEVILKTLQCHERVQRIQELGCRALAALSESLVKFDKAMLVTIAKASLIHVILSAMRRHRRVKSIQLHGCRVLGSVAESLAWLDQLDEHGTMQMESTLVTMVDATFVKGILSAMKRHVGMSNIQEQGCRVLAALTECFNRQENGHQWIKSGGAKLKMTTMEMANTDFVHVIVFAMRRHEGVPRVQVAGCKVLAKLAWNQDISQIIGDSGGIQVLLTCLRNLQSETVRHSGYCALQTLANHDENRVLICKSGGIDIVLFAMRNQLVKNGNGCILLEVLARNHDIAAMIGARGGIEVMLSTILNSSNATCRQNAIRSLTILANHDENEKRIVAAGGIEFVLKAMELGETKFYIQDYGCELLAKLSLDEVHKVLMANTNGIRIIVSAMLRFSDCRSVQDNGIRLLQKLVRDDTNAMFVSLIMEECSRQELSPRVMTNHTHDQDTLYGANQMISRIMGQTDGDWL